MEIRAHEASAIPPLRFAELPDDPRFPHYHGVEWLRAVLPVRFEPWPQAMSPLAVEPGFHLDEISSNELRRHARHRPWIWPARRIHVLTDLHADATAFVDSLVATGDLARTGPGPLDFVLVPGREGARFVLAGDFLDKGPDNLELLRSVRRFLDLVQDTVLLVGNHDLRAKVGFLSAGRKEPHLAHLFIRMGQKVVPLLAQLRETYGASPRPGTTERAAHDAYFPDESWFDGYREVARGVVPEAKIEQELVRIRQKYLLFEAACARSGISMRDLDAIVERFREHFVEPGGEFSWFFDSLRVAHREGALLFVHAGLGDGAVELLHRGGVELLNATYDRMVRDGDLFELYHGPVGNCFRTKYRETDHPLTEQGVEQLRAAGICAIVHGHRNLAAGQRLMIRRGVLNFECDCSLDRTTRRVEGLVGRGAAVTTFHPDGSVVGVSSDRPGAKLLELSDHCDLLTVVDTESLGPSHQPPISPTHRLAGDPGGGPPPAVPITLCPEGANTMNQHEEPISASDESDPPESSGGELSQEAPAALREVSKLTYESELPSDEALNYLSSLVRGVQGGRVTLRQGEETLSLEPTGTIELKVKAAHKGHKEKLEIELSWRLPAEDGLEID
jgi:amphi-Trp domain-containing protein